MDLHDVTDLLPATSTPWRPGDAFLAGGTWLFSEPQPGTTRLLDLRAFGWPSVVESGDGLELAATCTLAELAAWEVPARWPAGVLARQCCDALLGSFKVWNEATVGGNVCMALPAGPMTSFTAALDGVAEVWTPEGERRAIPVVDLVRGPRQTALGPGELVRGFRLPAAALAARTAFRQISLARHGRSGALVIGRRSDDGTTVVTVTASTPRPVQVRWPDLPDPAVAVAEVEAVVGEWYADVHGLPAWRAAMTRRFVREVVSELSC